MKIERDGARRRLQAARGPLDNYFRDVGANRIEPDAAIETGLRKRVEADEAKHSCDAQELTARYAGALEAVDEARQAGPNFIASNRRRLEAEIRANGIAAHDEVFAAKAAFYAAIGAWSNHAAFARRCQLQWNEEPTVPPNPLGGALQEVDRAFAPLASGITRDPRRWYPIPAELAPGGDPDGADVTKAGVSG